MFAQLCFWSWALFTCFALELLYLNCMVTPYMSIQIFLFCEIVFAFVAMELVGLSTYNAVMNMNTLIVLCQFRLWFGPELTHYALHSFLLGLTFTMNFRISLKMEDEACLHSKFGYCKFKDRCTRKHYSETCLQPEVCKASKTWLKRHPKACRKFVKDELCRFGTECAYGHNIQPVQSTSCEIEAKLHNLENGVSEMARNRGGAGIIGQQRN